MDSKLSIAERVARELGDGTVVNLGIGLPTLVTRFLTPERQITIQAENGILGVGPPPAPGEEDADLVDAGKMPITALPGAAYFDSPLSFAMIRGGHIDAAVVGGLQVDEHGILANWMVPGKPVLGCGGAMDLAVGARKLIVAMLHNTSDGAPRLVQSLQYPITSVRPVDVVVTELALFTFSEGRMYLKELAPGVTLEELRSRTDARFEVPVALAR